MDEFLKIDWNPALEDMLDGEFVNVERFQRDSAMYRALRGTLDDPFADLHKDYEHMVTKELMSQVAAENVEKREIAEVQYHLPQQEQTAEAPQEERTYVPGIMRTALKFPKCSDLNAQQQALSLRVLLRFSGSEKPSITATDKEKLQTYMTLMPVISKEQDAFLELAKSNWDPSSFEIREEEFINAQWKKRVKLVDSLPRYYTETGNIPFVSSKQIGINFYSTCLQMGVVPKIFLPKLTRRFLMPPNAPKMNQRFFSSETSKGPEKNVIFKTPVSQDPNCEALAKLHEVDLVISSGGLNCLALNIDPNVSTSWILPIVVKRVNDKNIVFVDKPLPPTGLTALQKNAWLHKYNIKSHLAHPYHCSAARLDDEQMETHEEPGGSSQIDETEPNDNREENTDGVAECENPEENDERKSNFVPPPMGHNLFYRLFSIGSSSESQNDPVKKRAEKVYRLLVRSKMDGILKTNTGEEQLTTIASKVEHQLALGAEAVSVEEAVKQWMSLTFRPNTSLVRVRMEATSMEFIQFEKRTAISINNEIKRLYNLKTEAALTLLYNVAETMTAMNPGRYLMRHTVRNGAFACIYKEADGPGKNVFDLQTVYWGDEFLTMPNPPWPPLDKVVVTPSLKIFNRMPAMFHPPRNPIFGGRQNAGNKRGELKLSLDSDGGRGGRRGRGSRGGKGGRGGGKKTAGRGEREENPVPE